MAKIIIWTIKNLVDTIIGCVDNQFDCILFIEGKRGCGKSTLAYVISKRCKRRGLIFNPHTHIAYTREEIIRLLSTQKRSVIFGDELINVAYNRDFYEQDQKVLMKALNMYRDSCNVFIGCIPKFSELDKQIQGLCKIKITVKRRGLAIIHTQLESTYNQDVWDTKTNQKIEGGRKFSHTKLTTYKGHLVFKDLQPKSRKIYDEIKSEKRNQVYSEYNDMQPKDYKQQVVDNIYDQLVEFKMTREVFDMVCRTSGLKLNSLKNRLNDKFREDNTGQTLSYYWKQSDIKKKEAIDMAKKKKSKNKIAPVPSEVDVAQNNTPLNKDTIQNTIIRKGGENDNVWED